MKLANLLLKTDYRMLNGSDDIAVCNLVYDSRNVHDGDVFVCVSGAVCDGHDYIDKAVSAGAACIVVERDIEITKSLDTVAVVRVDDTRLALANMSAAFFGYPDRELFTIGITGTKGKTTSTFMVYDILNACGVKTGIIGTIETIIGDEHIPSENTTPESYKIHEYFRRMVDAGIKCVVMEVSSQAFKLHRTAGIVFDIGVFTNLEPDHIGPNEHADFEEYLRCKKMLFGQCKKGIVNSDSEYVERIVEGAACSIETYGINNKADLMAYDINYGMEGGAFETGYRTKGTKTLSVKLSLPGDFSVYNSLCALAVVSHFDLDDGMVVKALHAAKVAGRVEPVNVSDKFIAMIDYAHNAMSLQSLLTTLRGYNPKRIVTLFGCGGNRSRQRRFEMGEISGKLSDLTVITSDNPRNEEPEDIMRDIETGIKKTDGQYVMIEDRYEAVEYAIRHGQPGDIIVIAGKGHEDYQEIKGVKHHMSDRELVQRAAKKD